MSVHEVDCLLESTDSVLALVGELDGTDWQDTSISVDAKRLSSPLP